MPAIIMRLSLAADGRAELRPLRGGRPAGIARSAERRHVHVIGLLNKESSFSLYLDSF